MLRPPLPGRRVLRELRHQRSRRLLAVRTIREALISLAGLLDRPVRNQAGAEVGKLVDVVARWATDDAYPPVTGLVVRIGGRRAFLAADQIAQVDPREVRLRSARFDLRDFERRPGEVLLARDVLDHQLVDVEGVKVIRAADLYLAPIEGSHRLVGVDVSLQTLLRRLGPARFRSLPTPDRVIDWAAIQPFAGDEGQVPLRTWKQGLQRLRPGELADLLEDLGRSARLELLASLEPDTAADALEEMEPRELEALLHEAPPERASALLASMEPDEAVDALRSLSEGEREELLDRMPPETARHLAGLLDFPSDRAGGFMTTSLVRVSRLETVADVRERLRALAERQPDLDTVAVVDERGRLVDVVSVLELFVADPGERVAALTRAPGPVAINADASLEEVAEGLTEARESTLVVVDDLGRPLGRILADDVIDALLPERGRLRFPRLLQ